MISQFHVNIKSNIVSIMRIQSQPCSLFLIVVVCLLLSSLSSTTADGISNNASTSISHINIIQCMKQERDALLQFKHGIEADQCGLLSSWGDQSLPDCCTWRGVRCSHHTGHVIMLDVHGADVDYGCLQGKVSPSLLELKHLRYLDLSNNNFQGQLIPSFIGSLSDLQHLDLSNGDFMGGIPPQLGNLSKLTFLDVSDNMGIYSNGLEWLSHLTLLRDINFADVDLGDVSDSWLKVFNNLPFLTTLQMDACQLITPKTPSSLSYVNSTTTLGVLSLSANQFDDNSIFEWLLNLSGTATHLLHVDLSDNSIPGRIPSHFANLNSLSYLDLSYNQLEGLVPDTVWTLEHLTILQLNTNNFHGIAPPKGHGSGGLLCSLRMLDVSNNNLTDDLNNIIQPISTCANSSLEYLDLSYNRFIGSLSHKHLSNLLRLNALRLSDNQALVINISANWIPPFQLDEIDLKSCKVGPCFPKWLLTQTNFSVLDLSNTGISDSIPTSFWNSLPSHLNYLNVSHNNIQGTLPNFIGVFNNLDTVDLSSNCLEGTIPLLLTKGLYFMPFLKLNNNMFTDPFALLCPRTKTTLSYLDLSNNLLSGELPDCWMDFYDLQYLNLGNNNFTGNLPPSIGALTDIQYLFLRNNDFRGELLMSLKNFTRLSFLDLSHNSFIGHIPPWIGSTLTYCSVLNLRSNKFEGKLPLSLCQLSNLQVLDLSANHISGTIPKCIYNLTAMKTVGDRSVKNSSLLSFDSMIMWKRKEQSFELASFELVRSLAISDNDLEGQIPSAISSLTGLGSLDLSRNNLNGSIPTNIGQLTALQFLDLSSNRLSGRIPTSLTNVASLGTLNLSNNNLSGSIPGGTQLQGFDPSSYSANTQLCGFPLPKCPSDQAPLNKITQQEENDGDDIFPGLYISVVLGFITGFWAVCGTLVLKRSWRHAYFRFFDDMMDRLHVMFTLSIARIWRKREVS